jgi:ankyrin repeat protein
MSLLNTKIYKLGYLSPPPGPQVVKKIASNLNIQNNSGATPLHWAVIKGNEDIVLKLIECGALLDIKDIYGATTIDWAIVTHHSEILLELLHAKAKITTHEERSESNVAGPIKRKAESDDYEFVNTRKDNTTDQDFSSFEEPMDCQVLGTDNDDAGPLL